MWHSGKLIIKILENYFYNAHSKTVVNNRLRIYLGDNFVIIDKTTMMILRENGLRSQ